MMDRLPAVAAGMAGELVVDQFGAQPPERSGKTEPRSGLAGQAVAGLIGSGEIVRRLAISGHSGAGSMSIRGPVAHANRDGEDKGR